MSDKCPLKPQSPGSTLYFLNFHCHRTSTTPTTSWPGAIYGTNSFQFSFRKSRRQQEKESFLRRLMTSAFCSSWCFANSDDQTVHVLLLKTLDPPRRMKNQNVRQQMSDKNESMYRGEMSSEERVTADAAAGSLEDVVALPRLLHLPPVAVVHPPSSAVVTHREHQTEQSWSEFDSGWSRNKFSRPPPLLLLLYHPSTKTH